MTDKKRNMNDEEINIRDKVTDQLKQPNIPLWRELESLIVFILIFVIIIPILLLKTKNMFVLLYYFSNLDLLANVLNYWNVYFDNLYFPTPLSNYSFFSSTFINFFALMGITTLSLNIAFKYNSTFYGLAASTTALLITYLIPTTIIYKLMMNIDNYLKNRMPIDISNTISVIIGLFISLLFILTEVFLSYKFIDKIANFYKLLYKKIKA